MSIQAQKLAALLKRECIDVLTINAVENCGVTKHLPGVRTFVRELRYLGRVLANARRCDAIHHFVASGLYFFLFSAPAILIARLCRSTIVLNYRGGNADQFLSKWGFVAVPIMRLADFTVVPSSFLNKVLRSHGIDSRLLPNIADIQAFQFRARTKLAPRLLVTRNLEPMYNVECVLRAFERIQQRFSASVLGIAGTGREEIRLKQLARQLRLNVKFYGAVSPDDMPELYDRFDIWLNASNVDNFPGALVEAACCGLPIVTTAAGGIPDMIQNGSTGLLVPLNDDRALAEAAISLLEHPEIAARLAERAHQWAQQFGWETIFPTLLKYYKGDANVVPKAPGCHIGD
jgi:glycosyltransferase involved in cell wall biosynthesis